VPVPGLALRDIMDDSMLKKGETEGKKKPQDGDSNAKRNENVEIEFFVTVYKSKSLEWIEKSLAETGNGVVGEKAHDARGPVYFLTSR
jgi:hypothetical protein